MPFAGYQWGTLVKRTVTTSAVREMVEMVFVYSGSEAFEGMSKFTACDCAEDDGAGSEPTIRMSEMDDPSPVRMKPPEPEEAQTFVPKTLLMFPPAPRV
jgi:hypothetical protein